jgi:hypothetical protein
MNKRAALFLVYYSWGIKNHTLAPKFLPFFIYDPCFLGFNVSFLKFIDFAFQSFEFKREKRELLKNMSKESGQSPQIKTHFSINKFVLKRYVQKMWYFPLRMS